LVGVWYGLTHKMATVVCARRAGANPGTRIGQCVNKSATAVVLHYGVPMLLCAAALGALVIGVKVLAATR
jgi:hypothetical protein